MTLLWKWGNARLVNGQSTGFCVSIIRKLETITAHYTLHWFMEEISFCKSICSESTDLCVTLHGIWQPSKEGCRVVAVGMTCSLISSSYIGEEVDIRLQWTIIDWHIQDWAATHWLHSISWNRVDSGHWSIRLWDKIDLADYGQKSFLLNHTKHIWSDLFKHTELNLSLLRYKKKKTVSLISSLNRTTICYIW